MPSDTGSARAPDRPDPYRNFKFRLKWDGHYVAGFSRVSALNRTTQVVAWRDGGGPSTPRRMPGQAVHDAITLERGLTHDPAFEQWADKVWDYRNSTVGDGPGGTGNQDVSLKDFRRDVVLELYNEAGQRVLAYTIYRCWPSEFVALAERDADANAVAIQSLKLENEGWERDLSVTALPEASFTLPAS